MSQRKDRLKQNYPDTALSWALRSHIGRAQVPQICARRRMSCRSFSAFRRRAIYKAGLVELPRAPGYRHLMSNEAKKGLSSKTRPASAPRELRPQQCRRQRRPRHLRPTRGCLQLCSSDAPAGDDKPQLKHHVGRLDSISQLLGSGTPISQKVVL